MESCAAFTLTPAICAQGEIGHGGGRCGKAELTDRVATLLQSEAIALSALEKGPILLIYHRTHSALL